MLYTNENDQWKSTAGQQQQNSEEQQPGDKRAMLDYLKQNAKDKYD